MDRVRLVIPQYDHKVVDLILELEHVRKRVFIGTTPNHLFLQIKEIFQWQESIGSARIEGNHTTIAEYIDAVVLDDSKNVNNTLLEIQNINSAINYIDNHIDTMIINKQLLCELQQIIVANLSTRNGGEGDDNAGNYRNKNVKIVQSKHTHPDMIKIPEYMEDLVDFYNQDIHHKYDLLKIAISHHRFVWIHPFNNGNGRTVRLLTYAMLLKSGFKLNNMIVNPTAVFCIDRDKYYHYLAIADQGSDDSILQWAEYMLSGLLTEIKKIDKLLEYDYLSKHILLPAIDIAFTRHIINSEEAKIVKLVVDKQIIQARDIKELLQHKHAVSTTRVINKLIIRGLLQSLPDQPRKYVLNVVNNILLREIMKLLDKNGFLVV